MVRSKITGGGENSTSIYECQTLLTYFPDPGLDLSLVCTSVWFPSGEPHVVVYLLSGTRHGCNPDRIDEQL